MRLVCGHQRRVAWRLRFAICVAAAVGLVTAWPVLTASGATGESLGVPLPGQSLADAATGAGAPAGEEAAWKALAECLCHVINALPDDIRSEAERLKKAGCLRLGKIVESGATHTWVPTSDLAGAKAFCRAWYAKESPKRTGESQADFDKRADLAADLGACTSAQNNFPGTGVVLFKYPRPAGDDLAKLVYMHDEVINVRDFPPYGDPSGAARRMPYKAPSAGHPLSGKIRTGQREYMDLEGYRADLAFLDSLKPSLVPGSPPQDAWARAFEETLRNLARVVKSLCTTLDELSAAIGGMPDGAARSEAISYRDELKKCKDEGVITLADGCKVHEESDGNPSGGSRRWPPETPPKVPPTTK